MTDTVKYPAHIHAFVRVLRSSYTVGEKTALIRYITMLYLVGVNWYESLPLQRGKNASQTIILEYNNRGIHICLNCKNVSSPTLSYHTLTLHCQSLNCLNIFNNKLWIDQRVLLATFIDLHTIFHEQIPLVQDWIVNCYRDAYGK
jgi:hypothetical protein